MSFVDKHAMLIFLFLKENDSVPTEAEIFPSPQCPMWLWALPGPRTMGTRVLSLGAQWQVHGQMQGTIPVSLCHGA